MSASNDPDLARAAAGKVCVGFDGLRFNAELKELIDRGVSSVILFTRNYESPSQLAELCWRIKLSVDRPIVISIDQEGGRVQRLREPFTIIPSMRELGLKKDVGAAKAPGHVMARELRAVNIDMNLAPVLDVDSNPKNPVIGERSFGCDPNLVSEMGCALIEGLQGQKMTVGWAGVAACGKHFPGHGDTSLDSHFHLPRVSQERCRLEQVEFPPFRAAIEAGVAAIMCAHVLYDAIDRQFPATMSAAVIQELLRAEMKFDRVVCSDDMEMKAILDHFGIEEAVERGAAAGVDLFFVCKDHALQHRAIDALIKWAARDERNRARMGESNQRLNRLMNRFVKPGLPWTQQSSSLFKYLADQSAEEIADARS